MTAVQSAVCVCVISAMDDGKSIQCDVWCESQYDGDATSCGRSDGRPRTRFVTGTCIIPELSWFSSCNKMSAHDSNALHPTQK